LLPCIVALAGLAGCEHGRRMIVGTPSTGQTPATLIGEWGGSGIHMTVDVEQAAITYNCGDGVVPSAIVPDETGHFQVDGTYTANGPGPSGGTPRPARHTGSVSGIAMSMTVTLLDTGQSVGTYNLELGQDGLLNFCASPR